MHVRTSIISLFLVLVLEDLLRDVDTVQELSDILISNVDALVDEGSYLGYVVHIDSADPEFVLHLWVVENSAAWLHDDDLGLGSSQEVSELDGLRVISDEYFDWEVSVYTSHLVSESSGNSVEHVSED